MLERVQGCPGAVRLYDCFEDERSVQLVMELCRGGDLKKYVEVRQEQAREEAALHFAADCLRLPARAQVPAALCASRGTLQGATAVVAVHLPSFS